MTRVASNQSFIDGFLTSLVLFFLKRQDNKSGTNNNTFDVKNNTKERDPAR